MTEQYPVDPSSPQSGFAVMHQTMPVWHRGHAAGPRDDTTRYLCAAVHLDSTFADTSIREFLVEDTRALAPSPGLDSAAVLREAVAARTRRKVRDSTLAVLAVLFLVSCIVGGHPLLPFGWILTGVLYALAMRWWEWRIQQHALLLNLVARLRTLLRTQRRRVLVPTAVLSLLLWAGSSWTLLTPTTSLTLTANDYYGGYLLDPVEPVDSGVHPMAVVAAIVLALMLAVLVTDRVVVWRLATRWFRRHGIPDNPAGSGPQGPRWVDKLSHPPFLAATHRYRPNTGPAADSGRVPLIVHRGFAPFVGAGEETRAWSLAIPLDDREEPAADERRERSAEQPLTTELLYRELKGEIAKLSQATPLSPSGRLAGLTVTDQIVIPATELVDHCLAQPGSASEYLRSAADRPSPDVSAGTAKALADHSQEWARYYLCLQIETWDRDLVVSVFVHFAMDQQTVYVEWTPCVLNPIKHDYQHIDSWSTSYRIPVLQALSKLFTLPTTMPGRIAHTLSWIRPLPSGRGTVNPDRYGASQSLREIAAGSEVHNYFQLLDVDRYLKLLETRFVRLIGEILDNHGYSSALFREQALSVTRQHINISGSVSGNIVAGNLTNTGTMSNGAIGNTRGGST